ncbi:hypothetical protein GCM10022217_08230 [Chryseobacterium ginsenosidimutans]|uniref:terpene synthase family protein n=1 Tax=Chryseobacterium ginsenosidimutans TaxID=687846 RepID=UPI0031DC82FE
MKPEDFNPQDYLPLNYYPWPNRINPFSEQVGIELNKWIDNDYTSLTLKQREKYKKMGFHLCTGRMAPTISYEQMIPCTRFLAQIVILDDQLEFLSREAAKLALDRLIEILKGSEPLNDEKSWFHQMAIIRDEFSALMPAEWMAQFAKTLQRCVKYGAEEEMPYKSTKSSPPLEYFMILREYSIIMYPFFIWSALEVGFVLPENIYEHPVIQRITALASRIVGWQNDFYSLPKELRLDSEVINLILILQKTHNISLEEACMQAKSINDKDVAEFVLLHENLPDFGIHQQKVYDYIACMGTTIQGINSHYILDTLRYATDGFAWPEINGNQV